jgi:hypothetical protein
VAEMFPQEGNIYSERGFAYLKMAQQETDPSKKTEYQKSAEENSDMYTKLTGKTVDWK